MFLPFPQAKGRVKFSVAFFFPFGDRLLMRNAKVLKRVALGTRLSPTNKMASVEALSRSFNPIERMNSRDQFA